MRNGLIFWFTGLSGAGKSAISQKVKERLAAQGFLVDIIDGDDVRNNRNKPLTFSWDDIAQNNRAVASICAQRRLTADIIIVPIISPIRQVRAETRQTLSPGYYEVYIKASLACVQQRDVKGLYRKVMTGQIKDMIGCAGGVAYEAPIDGDLTIDTESLSLDESADLLYDFIKKMIN